MEDYEKNIEIPFGANDSELGGFEYTIPEGYEAEIKDGKVIVRKVESEDERIRKAIHIYLDWLDGKKDVAPKGEYSIRDMIAWLEKQGEQKPVEWSKEDEFMRRQCIGAIQLCNCCPETKDGILDWLRSLKDRVQPQSKQEWSEEDEKCLNELTQFFENLLDCIATEERHKENRRWLNWLKSLRPQNTWKPSDLPHWKKSTLPNDNTTGFNSDYFCYKGYNINYKELFEKLPKDD